jgi:DNA-binding NarL/FixJ family response regulator
MQATHIVLLQSDPHIAQTLSSSLINSFHGVHVAQSVDDLRHAAAKHHPRSIILDLESASLADVEELKREFTGIRIICNHRVADEEMWTRTLTAGADDCCPSYDTRAILSAAVQDADQQMTRVMIA